MVLHLDSNFRPVAGNEIKFKSFTFSGGEPHIKIESGFDISERVVVTHRINSFNDLGIFCVAIDALRHIGVRHVEGVIPYFPAARQDRLMIPGEPLTVKVYARIINALHLNKVYIFDAHSEVAPALIENCIAIDNHEFIAQIVKDLPNMKLIAPDGGALKKIYKLSAFLNGIDVIECSKSRDVKTGKLSGFKVFTDDLEGADCLIVDDICDGGMTFVGLAEALRQKNAGKLYLAVSHGIFSKGTEVLLAHFEKIYTTNSFRDISEDRIAQIPLQFSI